ncbi:MAG: serine/threonine-protein kinase [Candidatus Hodarchaeales archaeon]|jgi:serine/threonine-protein kinase
MTTVESFNSNHIIGKQIGTSTILSELARGSMAIVFIAYQRTLKRRIAVKILPKTLLAPKTAELFQQEAEAAAILSHPNIIQIYEVGDTDEFLFFTMQLIQGEPLTKLIQMAQKHVLPSKRTLPLEKTLRIIIHILDALHYAHQQEIIHRDIKPDNILIEKHTQRSILTDFGVAKVLRQGDEDNSMIRGTPLYMAPEQILGETRGGLTDIYAVGTMLFQMIVPALPLPKFDSYDALLKYKLLNKTGFFLKNPSELNPFLNKEMDKIIENSIAYEPEKRYDNCQEIKSKLEWYCQKYLR